MERILSVTLPEETTYAHGTVNGSITTWTNVRDNIWETVADRALDDVYHVEIEFIDESGITYNLSRTLYYGKIPLVTDRTLADVERWRELHDKGLSAMTETEKLEWFGFMKGRYTYEDMNRVESAVAALYERLRKLGYIHSTLEIKTNWTHRDEVKIKDIERYLGNVKVLRNSVRVFPNTPIPPDISVRLNYILANNIEKILTDVDTVTINFQQSQFYVGDLISGEV